MRAELPMLVGASLHNTTSQCLLWARLLKCLLHCGLLFLILPPPQVLPYDMLQAQLSISTVRDLEDFLITDCFYTGGG
jgi:hypothetical protein